MKVELKGLVIAYSAFVTMGVGITVVPAIDMNAVTLVFYRALFAIPLLAGLLVVRGNFPKIERFDFRPLALMGFVTAAHWVTLFLSFKLGTIAIGIISFYTYPVFVTFAEAAVQKRKPRSKDIILALVTFGGVTLLTPFAGAPAAVLPAVLTGVFSAVLWAIRIVLVHNKLSAYPSSSLMLWNLVVVALALFPSAFYEASPIKWEPVTFLQIGFLTVVITCLCHTMILMSLRFISATRLGQIGPVQIFAAILSGWLFLGEELSLRIFCGAMVVSLVSIYTFKEANYAPQEQNMHSSKAESLNL